MDSVVGLAPNRRSLGQQLRPALDNLFEFARRPNLAQSRSDKGTRTESAAGGEANQVPEKHPPNCTLPHRPPHGFEYATRADFQAFCIHRQVLSTPMCRFGRTLGPILPMLAEIGPILAIAIRIRPIVFPKSAKFGQHPLPVHPTRPEPSLGSVSR